MRNTMREIIFNDQSTLTGNGWLHGFFSVQDQIVAVIEIIRIQKEVGCLTGNIIDIKYRRGQIIQCPISTIDILDHS